MSRLRELGLTFNNLKKQVASLEKEYESKVKGDSYRKRYTYLIDKMADIKKKYMEYGSGYTIMIIKGKRNRVSKRNPQLRLVESVELYLVGVQLDELDEIIRVRYPNIFEYTIRNVISGKTL